jgi:hypothetical protein
MEPDWRNALFARVIMIGIVSLVATAPPLKFMEIFGTLRR